MLAIDQFSKTIKLNPLHELPSGFKTAELIFENIFCHFNISEDIMSDRVRSSHLEDGPALRKSWGSL